jgi:hypothetical protein
LPFLAGWPLAAGATLGLALRLVFSSRPGGHFATMLAAFVLMVPTLVGALTVYLAERQYRRSWGYYIGAPALANTLLIVGALLTKLEGTICAILLIPLAALFGAVGGLVMGIVCRYTRRASQTVYSMAVLPLLLGPLESQIPARDRIEAVDREVTVAAPAGRVWQQIWEVNNIQPNEVDRGWIYRIGVPVPQSGITQRTPDGLVRRIRMGKGIHFDQVYVSWQPERYVLWTYRFAPDSVPPAALDDHVRIGGAYFDLIAASYTLTPVDNGTRLRVSMQYRVSTHYNWYTGRLARWLIGDFEERMLDCYRVRSQDPARAVTQLPVPLDSRPPA